MRKGNREKRERKRVDYSKKAREIRKGLHWRENGRSKSKGENRNKEIGRYRSNRVCVRFRENKTQCL
ncbi:hypothetical protein GYH30_007600 [Glycine max]|uniref:Uncharacterized protein n=1 Tax=Glycine max TaxID=3847 RepID=K7KFS6_SOYBN|nr:hypothetical protein GYH30_007600 [Glycine max]